MQGVVRTLTQLSRWEMAEIRLGSRRLNNCYSFSGVQETVNRSGGCCKDSKDADINTTAY